MYIYILYLYTCILSLSGISITFTLCFFFGGIGHATLTWNRLNLDHTNVTDGRRLNCSPKFMRDRVAQARIPATYDSATSGNL